MFEWKNDSNYLGNKSGTRNIQQFNNFVFYIDSIFVILDLEVI